MENLEGVPEARIVGFPIGLQAAGALAGGAGAAGAALRSVKKTDKRMPARQVAALGAGGAVAGALAGKLMNSLIAQVPRDLKGYNRPSPQHFRCLLLLQPF